jgi:uncharacterized protein YjbI with pentapeptide repeats
LSRAQLRRPFLSRANGCFAFLGSAHCRRSFLFGAYICLALLGGAQGRSLFFRRANRGLALLRGEPDGGQLFLCLACEVGPMVGLLP